MEDEFGRCYVACMNRCADGCRRDRDMPWRPGVHHGARRALLRGMPCQYGCRHGAGRMGI